MAFKTGVSERTAGRTDHTQEEAGWMDEDNEDDKTCGRTGEVTTIASNCAKEYIVNSKSVPCSISRGHSSPIEVALIHCSRNAHELMLVPLACSTRTRYNPYKTANSLTQLP